MPTPRLLHPVPVQIERINRSATIQDDDYREPVQQAIRGPVVTVPGQIKWGWDDQISPQPSKSGSDMGSDGYVLFRYQDLVANGITIGQNDRIIKMGSLVTDVYVVHLQPMGHYSNLGGPGLVRAFFKDRFPAKRKPDAAPFAQPGSTFARTVSESVHVSDGVTVLIPPNGLIFSRVINDTVGTVG